MFLTVDNDDMICIPDSIREELGWNEKTFLTVSMVDNELKISTKLDWSIDELEEHIEDVVEWVSNTGVELNILHKGKVFKMIDVDTFNDLYSLLNDTGK